VEASENACPPTPHHADAARAQLRHRLARRHPHQRRAHHPSPRTLISQKSAAAALLADTVSAVLLNDASLALTATTSALLADANDAPPDDTCPHTHRVSTTQRLHLPPPPSPASRHQLNNHALSVPLSPPTARSPNQATQNPASSRGAGPAAPHR
jgi:hypothetical protein